ncbi:MAG: hypothetical protein RMI90_16580, partial [Thermoguttaceae bacterium]|nr:hypothetical protein [Thermoguttaceae bacterium]
MAWAAMNVKAPSSGLLRWPPSPAVGQWYLHKSVERSQVQTLADRERHVIWASGDFRPRSRARRCRCPPHPPRGEAKILTACRVLRHKAPSW